MADQKIAIEIEIGGEQKSLATLNEIKKARKQLTEAALLGDQQAINSLKKLEDKFGDLQDSAKAVRGDGLEPLKNSFNLFKEGISNFDLGKIGTAFKGLGAAMKAVPIFLLVEGITYLVTNFKELSEGTGILAKALQPIGDLIGWITDGLYALTDAIGLTNSELDKMSEAATENATKAQEALALQNAEYDRQIAVAKSAGKSTVEMEKAKQEAIIETNKQIVEQQIALIRAGAVMDEERKKLITQSLEAIKNAKTQEKVIENTVQKERETKYKSHLDELDKKDKELLEERKRREKELDDYRRVIQKDWEKEQDKIKERFLESKAFEDQTDKDYAEEGLNTFLDTQDKKKKAKDDEKSLDMARFNEVASFAKTNTESQAQLINFLFDLKRSKAQKGSAEDLKLAKKQFQINKALAIQSSIISGIQGVVNALSANSVVPEPYGTILKVATAAAVGIAATINTAKIASQQFNPEGGGGGSVAADTGGMGGASAPVVQTPNNTVTKIDDDGKIQDAKKQDQKVYVTEGDISTTQKRVKTIEEAATL